MNIWKRLHFKTNDVHFWLKYWTATRNVEKIRTLTGSLFESVTKDGGGLSGIRWMLFDAPGYNHETSPLCWEAPVAILLYYRNKPIFGIGLEIYKKKIHIRQLQGISGVKFPKKIKGLPAVCVGAIVDFAKQQNFSEVRLYRAHCDMFYQEPHLPNLPEGKTRDEVVNEIRQRMRRRYDGTARQLGFVMKKDYGELVLSH